MTEQSTTHLATAGLEFQRDDRCLFSELELSLAAGQVLQIEGPNGSGKTTLLKLLCGLLWPSAGSVRWGGSDIRDCLADFRAELAYVGHIPAVKDELTPLENLEFAGAIGRPRAGVSAEDALFRVGLPAARMDVPCRKLSAGQRRRVALARLLATSARLWVLDEPFTALDPAGRALVEHLIEEHVAGGGLAVLTTHHVMKLDADRVRHLHLGGQRS